MAKAGRAPHLSKSRRSSGKLPVERRCRPASWPSWFWLFSKCWMMVLTLPGLTVKEDAIKNPRLRDGQLATEPGPPKSLDWEGAEELLQTPAKAPRVLCSAHFSGGG